MPELAQQPATLGEPRTCEGMPSTLGQYEILEEIGRGGFGRVFKARHRLMERLVALKVIAPDLVANRRVRDLFRREVVAATRLQHPNIVLAYDADEVDDFLFLVMELVEGRNLHQVVKKHGPLPVRSACELFHQAAKALHAAHEQGLVHRDIKPANLLLPTHVVPYVAGKDASTPQGVLVKIVDFGLARLNDAGRAAATNGPATQVGFVGTPEFVAPEQAHNSQAADVRSDIYSLGCTFYYALTGKYPFKGETALETMVQHLEKEALPLRSHRPDIPEGLVNVVRRMMAKDAAKRFQNPGELIIELNYVFPQLNSTPTESSLDLPNHAANEDSLPLTTRLPMMPLPVGPRAADPKSAPAAAPQKGDSLSPEDNPRDAPLPPSHGVPVSSHSAPSTLSYGAPLTAAAIPFERALLAGAWRTWLAAVSSFLGEGKTPLGADEYRALHAKLVQTIRAAGADAPEADRDRWIRLELLVRPWLTFQSLKTADAPALRSMRERCRVLENELGLARRPMPLWAILSVVAVAIGAGASIALSLLR